MDIQSIANQLKKESKYLPISKLELEDALELLIYQILFPICSTQDCVGEKLGIFRDLMLCNVQALVDEDRAEQVLDTFISELPTLQERLYKEAEVYYKNDPAANSIEEVLLSYPGFYALAVHRIAHRLLQLDIPIIPRLFSEYAHSKVGVDINPGATIGDHFYIDHGTGIVIGETTTIGNNVTIYQGVTLGALFVTKELANKKRHPTIEDNVVIYAGATILGGNTVIGHDSVIGGNAWLTHSVVPYSQVLQTSTVRIRSSLNRGEAVDFFI